MRCNWPVRGPRDKRECGRVAVAVIRSDDETYPRCHRHLTEKAIEYVREHRWALVPA